MLNFDFLRKDLGIFSPPHFVYNFSKRMFLMLYSINLPHFIVRLHLLLEILGNMCIVIACFPSCDLITVTVFILDQRVKTKMISLSFLLLFIKNVV